MVLKTLMTPWVSTMTRARFRASRMEVMWVEYSAASTK